MARYLANKNMRLTAHTGWVLDTDYEIAGTQDAATILLASANEVDAVLLHNLVTVRDYVLGATSEETINDPPIGLIGSSENVAGQTSYDGSQLRTYRNSTAGDDLWSIFLKGVSRHLVERIGVLSTTAYTAADKVSLYDVTFSSPMKEIPGGGGYFTALHKINVAQAWEHSTVAATL